MNEIKFKIKSELKNVALARSFIQIIALEYNQTISFINELKTSISEAVTNAIIHGYEGRVNEEVEVLVNVNDELIKIEVKDTGIGIQDLEEARTPMFSTKKENDRSGLGFTIMEIFSDSFEVVSEKGKGTNVTIVKKWHKNE